MEIVRPWCGEPSDRERLKNRTELCVDRPTLPHPPTHPATHDERRYLFSVRLSQSGFLSRPVLPVCPTASPVICLAATGLPAKRPNLSTTARDIHS